MVDTQLLKAIRTQRTSQIPLRSSTGVDLVLPGQQPDEIGKFESFSAAAQNSGIVTGAIRAGVEATTRGFNFEPTPGFNATSYARDNETVMQRLQPILDGAGSGRFDGVIDRLKGAQSEAEFDAIIGQFEERTREMEAMAANPWTALAGTVAGVTPDIAAAAGALLIPGGQATAAQTASIAGGRLLAATSMAILGAAEGVGERTIQGLTNPYVTSTDIAEGGAIGALIGGGLGAIAPRLIGNVNVAVPEPRNLEEMIQQVDAIRGRSVGAAQAEDTLAVPAQGSEGIGLGSKVGTGAAAQNVFRSPKRVAVDIGTKGREDLGAGLKGNATAFDSVNKIVRISTANETDVAAEFGRNLSAQDYRDALTRSAITNTHKSDAIYARMQKEMFDLGYLRNALKNTSLLGSSLRGNMKGLSKEEFETVADEYANAQANGLNLSFEELIPEDIRSKLDGSQMEKLESFVAEKAALDNQFYREIGQAEVDTGAIDAKDLIDGYRPQIWNKDAIETSPVEFEHFVLDILRKNPDDEWLVSRGWLNEGQTFDDIADRTLREEIIDDWAISVQDDIVETTQARIDKATARLQRSLIQADLDIPKLRKQGEEARASQRLLEERLQAVRTDAERRAISDQISALEVRQSHIDNLVNAGSVRGRVDVDTDLIRQIVEEGTNRAGRRAIREAQAAVERAEARQLNTVKAPNVAEEARLIREKIQNGDDPFGLADDALISTTGRFKRRALILKEKRHTPAARRFLRRNSQDNMTAYVSSTGPQVALRKAFDIAPGDKFNLNEVIKSVERAFDADIAASPENAARLRKDKVSAVRNIKGILDEFTSSSLAQRGEIERALDDLASIAGGVTSIALLNGVVISQLADIAVTAAAGGRLGTGLKGLLRPFKNKKFIKELEGLGEDDLALLARGPQVFDGSRTKAISEMDIANLDIPGGWLRAVARRVNDVGTLNGYVSFMHQWNRVVRGAFGVDFAKQISKDLADFDNLKPRMKTFYARLGIGSQEAQRMAALLDKHHNVVQGFKLPKSSAWANEDPDMLTRFKAAMQAAGDEAMINPSVGDRPFMRSNPIGRMVLQFQSFTFTMADRYLAPLVQSGRLGGPEEVGRTFGLLVTGLGFGALVESTKRALRGERQPDENDPEEMRDYVWAAFLRGPLMTGTTSTITEVLGNTMGRPANDGIEAILGVRPLKERPTRFRDQMPLAPFAGPAFSTANRAFTAGTQILEGDVEKGVDRLKRMSPVTATWWMSIYEQHLKEM